MFHVVVLRFIHETLFNIFVCAIMAFHELYATVDTELSVFMFCVNFESSTQNVVDKFEKAAGR